MPVFLSKPPRKVHRHFLRSRKDHPECAGGLPERVEILQDSAKVAGIWPLCISVFLLHALMTLLFVVLPGLLVSQHQVDLAGHWKIYIPTMVLSALLVFPLLHWVCHSRCFIATWA